MWEILHNGWKDFIIHSQNRKIYKIEEDKLSTFEKNNNYENNYKYYWDDIYNNEFLKYFQELYEGKNEIFYKDLDFWEDKVVYTYRTYIDDKFYEITPDFIKDMYENHKNKTFTIYLDLVDSKKWLNYTFWNYEIHFWYEWPWIFSGSSYTLSIFEKIYFNKRDFVEWFSNYYLSAKFDNWEYEKFTYVNNFTI